MDRPVNKRNGKDIVHVSPLHHRADKDWLVGGAEIDPFVRVFCFIVNKSTTVIVLSLYRPRPYRIID
jgi:hypothetical protein